MQYYNRKELDRSLQELTEKYGENKYLKTVKRENYDDTSWEAIENIKYRPRYNNVTFGYDLSKLAFKINCTPIFFTEQDIKLYIDDYFINDIEKINVENVTDSDLECFFSRQYSLKPIDKPTFDTNLSEKIERTLNQYNHTFEKLLPKIIVENYQHAEKSDLLSWSPHRFKVISSWENGDIFIEESFKINIEKNFIKDTIGRKRCLSFQKDIMPNLNDYINEKQKKIEKNKNNKLFKPSKYDINRLKELKSLVQDYNKELKKVIDYKNQNDYFIEKFILFKENNRNKKVLVVELKSGITTKYLEGNCSFDIFEKYIEATERLNKLKLYKQKEVNSNDSGEKSVEYALKWYKQSTDDYVVQIKADCESKYRLNCILLSKPEFIDEPQEFDHIIVCEAGVILIETKNWVGHVDIRSDGKWLKKQDNKPEEITDNPKFQMRRHEILMKKILPNVPVHSLLCFSNKSIVVDGKENFDFCPIIYIEQLQEALECINSDKVCTKSQVDYIAQEIEKHKISIK